MQDAYIHTHLHTYIHTHLHTYIHTYIGIGCLGSQAMQGAYMHTHIHTYIHTYIHTKVLEYWATQQLCWQSRLCRNAEQRQRSLGRQYLYYFKPIFVFSMRDWLMCAGVCVCVCVRACTYMHPERDQMLYIRTYTHSTHTQITSPTRSDKVFTFYAASTT